MPPSQQEREAAAIDAQDKVQGYMNLLRYLCRAGHTERAGIAIAEVRDYLETFIEKASELGVDDEPPQPEQEGLF